MSMALAVNMTMFTFTVMTLTIWPLHNTGSTNTMATVAISMTMAVTITDDTRDQDCQHQQDCGHQKGVVHDVNDWRLRLVTVWPGIFIHMIHDMSDVMSVSAWSFQYHTSHYISIYRLLPFRYFIYFALRSSCSPSRSDFIIKCECNNLADVSVQHCAFI